MVIQSYPSLLSHFQASGAPPFTRNIGLGYFPWNRWLKWKLPHHLEKQTGGCDPWWAGPLEASTHQYQERSKEQHFLALCTAVAVLLVLSLLLAHFTYTCIRLSRSTPLKAVPQVQNLCLEATVFDTFNCPHPNPQLCVSSMFLCVVKDVIHIKVISLSCTGCNSPLIRL